jgi:DNA-binding transcriptional MocR family regulator
MPTPQPTWQERVWQEYRAGTLTRAWRDVMLTLRTYRGYGGLICPSHETLAKRAHCAVSTVQRALQQARRLGLVNWTERRIRAGWRWLRSSNSYALSVPDTPVNPELRPVWWRRITTGQSDRGGESEEKQEGHRAALLAMVREAAVVPDLLAQRRAVVQQELLLKGWVVGRVG